MAAASEFDASEVIGGFPLVSIKRAICFVGLMEDADDVADVAKALRCGRSQATQVLEALARRGLVKATARKKRWEKTDLGWRLSFSWQPPRRIEPAIQREDEPGAVNEMLESVACSIMRGSDDGEFLEEADIEVGVFVDYESDRVVELSVNQPDDYDHRDEGGSTTETSVLLGVSEARKLAEALLTAVERGEAELARRAGMKGRSKARKAGSSKVAKPTKRIEKTKPLK